METHKSFSIKRPPPSRMALFPFSILKTLKGLKPVVLDQKHLFFYFPFFIPSLNNQTYIYQKHSAMYEWTPVLKWLLAINVSFSIGYNFYRWHNSFIEYLSFTTKTKIWIWFLQVFARSWKMREIDETKQMKRWGLKKDSII